MRFKEGLIVATAGTVFLVGIGIVVFLMVVRGVIDWFSDSDSDPYDVGV